MTLTFSPGELWSWSIQKHVQKKLKFKGQSGSKESGNKRTDRQTDWCHRSLYYAVDKYRGSRGRWCLKKAKHSQYASSMIQQCVWPYRQAYWPCTIQPIVVLIYFCRSSCKNDVHVFSLIRHDIGLCGWCIFTLINFFHAVITDQWLWLHNRLNAREIGEAWPCDVFKLCKRDRQTDIGLLIAILRTSPRAR